MTTGPVRDDGAREQRGLDLVVKAGGLLVAIGLLTTVVLLVEYFVGADLPGTWAYVVAMLAPLGFGLILLGLVGVALRRRQATLAGDSGRPSS
jgi:hypothetical protein